MIKQHGLNSVISVPREQEPVALSFGGRAQMSKTLLDQGCACEGLFFWEMPMY